MDTNLIRFLMEATIEDHDHNIPREIINFFLENPGEAYLTTEGTKYTLSYALENDMLSRIPGFNSDYIYPNRTLKSPSGNNFQSSSINYSRTMSYDEVFNQFHETNYNNIIIIRVASRYQGEDNSLYMFKNILYDKDFNILMASVVATDELRVRLENGSSNITEKKTLVNPKVLSDPRYRSFFNKMKDAIHNLTLFGSREIIIASPQDTFLRDTIKFPLANRLTSFDYQDHQGYVSNLIEALSDEILEI